MNKLMAVLLALALAAPASAWTILGDNILGNNFDYVTLRSPGNGDTIVFNATTGKWEAGSGGGGSLSIQTDGVAQGTASTLNFSNGLSASGGTTGNVSPTYGTGANTICQGNDSRLSDARAPTAHAASHQNGGSDEVATATPANNAIPKANGSNKLASGWLSEVLNLTDLLDTAITGAAAGDIIIRNSGNTLWVNQAKGSASTVFLIDSGGGMPTYGLVTSAMINNDTITDIDVNSANKDGAAGTASMRTLGTGAQQAAAGNDSRLSDARAPTAHAASHQNGGSDEVATATPGANAIPKAGGTNKLASGWLSEVLNLADLLDATMTGLANNDILMRIGGAWVNAVSAGDVTWTGSGNTITTTIGAQKVGVAKMTASATDVVFGRSSAGAGAGQEITFTSTARSIADDTSVGAVRTTLSAYGTVTKRVFSTPGTSTYTPTSGALHVIIECWGGGGAGGSVDGIATNNITAAGGGAGGYSRLYTTAAAASGLTVTVGTAGTAAAAGNNNGGNGGDSSVGTICVAKGGTGGGGSNGTAPPVGGAGGVAGTGDVTGVGARGNPGITNSGTTVFAAGGNGADSLVGGGGAGGSASSGVSAGNAGTGFASGGGAGAAYNTATDTTGGNGAGGLVVITEFTP